MKKSNQHQKIDMEFLSSAPQPSVSIIVPGLNEAGNIEKAVLVIIEALKKQRINDYEILLIDDGSTDGMDKIVDRMTTENDRLRSFHNPTPKGLGYNFRTGVFLAGKDYVGWFPGDNEVLPESINNTFSQIGKADAIVAYTANPWIRPLYRRLLSTAYTFTFNAVFGLQLKYFNGACFFRREALKDVVMTTDSPAYMAEILVQLIKKNGTTYVEVPHYIKAREYGRSSVLRWKNVYMIGKTIISILPRIYFQSRGRG